MEGLYLKSPSSIGALAVKHAERIGVVLRTPYEQYDKKMSFEVTQGEYIGLTGAIDYTGLRRTKKLSYNSLDLVSKRRYWDRIAEERGCTILEYDSRLRVNAPIVIEDRYGKIVTTDFTTLRRNKYNRRVSTGEQLVATVLDYNRIPYESQVKIQSKNGRQFIDFVVYTSEGKVAIEYNGVQHYADTYYFSRTLQEQQRADKAKQLFCIENSMTLVEIPYTANTLQEIANYLMVLGNLEVPTELKSLPNLDQLVLYDYMSSNMTRANVAKKYNISEVTVSKISKRHGFKKKVTNPKSVAIEKVVGDVLYDYIYLGLSRHEVADKYGVSLNTVTNIAKRHGFIKSSTGSITRL